jgi:hypothetical protein
MVTLDTDFSIVQKFLFFLSIRVNSIKRYLKLLISDTDSIYNYIHLVLIAVYLFE